MNSDAPTVDQLRAMLALHEERAKLQRQLDAIDEKLLTLQGRIFPLAAPRRPARTTTRGTVRDSERPPARGSEEVAGGTGAAPRKAPRNVFKGRVTEALTSAGEGGASLKELAEKLGTNYRNVAVWFATTGKRNSQIEKIGPGRYRLAAPGATGSAASPHAPQAAPSAGSPAGPQSGPEPSHAG